MTDNGKVVRRMDWSRRAGNVPGVRIPENKTGTPLARDARDYPHTSMAKAS